MRRRARRKVGILAFTLALSAGLLACLDIDRLRAGAPDAGDGASAADVEASTPSDGGTDAPTTDGDATTPGELLVNGGFEQGAVGCGQEWTANDQMTKVAGRVGSFACNACGNSAFVELRYTQPIGPGPAVGQVYRAEVYVKVLPPDAGALEANLYLQTFSGSTMAQEVLSPSRTLTGGWQKLEVPLEVTQPADRVATKLVAYGGGVTSPCLVADAYSVIRTQ
jgi:hypothetical protein